MKNYVHVLLIQVLLICNTNLQGKVISGQTANKMIFGASKILINDERHTIQFIQFDQAMAPLERNISTWIDHTFSNYLDGTILKFERKEVDQLGFTHYKYHQYFKKKQVAYSVIKFHCKENKIMSMNAEYYTPSRKVYSSILISEKNALDYVQEIMLQRNLKEETILKKFHSTVYFPMKNGDLKLCYKIDVSGLKEHLVASHFYVSTSNKNIVHEESAIHEINSLGTTTSNYSGIVNITTDSLNPTNFRLQENGLRNIKTKHFDNGSSGSFDISNNTNTWYNNSAGDVHYGSEKAWDYYFLFHNRNSFDGLGATIESNINFGINHPNAHWNGISNKMYYGDGDGIFNGPFTSINTVGHELTHAVTQYSAGLVYASESGALNESFSDIFGTAIEYYTNPSSANFLIGDELYFNGIPYRNMQNPNATLQPDTYLGIYWNGGDTVHTNSQVQNYWFYLLCHGGSGINDHGDNYIVSAIGMNDAAKIAYRNLNVYLTPNSQFFDARLYSIQSAIDLFGNCSPQVLQVINAWHAVGVGGFSSSGVYADFSADQTSFCIAPATVNFSDSSINATTYFWQFGDGTTSTLQNPSHTYLNSGVYTVTLIVSGVATCNSSDTLILTNFIHINNITPPVPTCPSIASSPLSSCGILNFTLNNINRSSFSALEGYQDFTCTDIALLDSSSQYVINLLLPPPFYQNVSAWLDFNGDGTFSVNELIGHVLLSNGILNPSILLNLPDTGVAYNQSLRLRINADVLDLANACTIPLYGQTEDYTVIIKDTTSSLPIADFMMSDSIVSIGGSVFFYDLTKHSPTSWQWIINGGLPNNANIQNPISTFNLPGTYSIKLIVSNANGSDTISKNVYVQNYYTMCNPTANITNLVNGTIYDSGGPNGPYSYNDTCSFLIAPGYCTDSILLTLHYLQNGPGSTLTFEAYDGMSTSANLLLSTSTYSNTPLTLKSLTDTIFIRVYTGLSSADNGFKATWVTYQTPVMPPIANFNFSPSIPTISAVVNFNDLSSSNTTFWNWNFGDGGISNLQNPNHIYSVPGTYTVTLISTSCGASDTSYQTISILALPPANFLASPLVAFTNQNIQFTDLTIGSPTSWNWSFVGSTPANSSLQNPLISFPTTGYYDVSLIASNATQSYALTQYNYIQIISMPNASFTANYIDCAGNISFVGNTPYPYTSSFWNFGDGNTLSTTSPFVQHTYLNQGIYNVTLIAFSPYGNDTIVQPVNVSIWNPSFFTSGFYTAGSPINFNINSTNPINNAYWDFGDGNTSTLISPTHIYASSGSYSIICIVVDSLGCTTVLSDSIQISISTDLNKTFENNIEIYPNPFFDKITVIFKNLHQADLFEFKLYNMLGELIYTEKTENLKAMKKDYHLPHNLGAANYNLVLSLNGKLFTRMLLKKD